MLTNGPFPVLLVFAFAGILLWVAGRAHASIGKRRVRRALSEGDPRQSRIALRFLAHACTPPPSEWRTFYDAIGLFWEGAFERALVRAESLTTEAQNEQVAGQAIAMKIACLTFTERIVEARQLLSAHSAELRTARPIEDSGIDGELLDAILQFYCGAVVSSRTRLELLAADSGILISPARHIIRFYLAAVAHQEGCGADARSYLDQIITEGRDLFIARWAFQMCEEFFPEAGNTKRVVSHKRRLRRARGPKHLLDHLQAGLMLLFFRKSALDRAADASDQTVPLLLVNLLVIALLRSTDYARGAIFVGFNALALAAPVLLLPIGSYLAGLIAGARHISVRLTGAFSSALPPLLILGFVAVALDNSAHPMLASLTWILTAGWSLALCLFLIRHLTRRVELSRALAAAVVFTAIWALPAQLVARSTIWFLPRPWSFDTERRKTYDFLFDQSTKLIAAETRLSPGRPGLEDLYFVGFAGSGRQDVFLKETQFAQRLFDERFDTRDRSLVLANDRAAQGSLPLATSENLAHVLKAMASRMNREEDVLFLFLTSHGSSTGLSIDVDLPEALEEDELTPQQLRSLLDDAGVTWRVLVVSGCASGAFVFPLRNPFTLIATASAADRNSFGCANGQEFTEFGKAFLGEQL